MKVLITGTSSGIGKATALLLIRNGHEVYGISRTPSGIDSPYFHEYTADLTVPSELRRITEGPCAEIDFDVLINNAGCGYYGLHENIQPSAIHEMVVLNLEVPMVLCGVLMKTLKKNSGIIINISSVTAKQHSPHGAAYGATKAGLTGFSASLFDEVRKHGVKVTAIHPEMTATGLYRNADFEAYTEDGYYLSPEDVADTILYVINSPASLTVNDITLNPQYHRIRRK